MAFNKTNLSPQLCDVVGIFPNMGVAVGALVAGSKVFTFPQFTIIETGFASSQTSNAARVSDITGNAVTVTGTGTDVVMLLVTGQARR